MTPTRRIHVVRTVLAVALGLALVACGSGDDDLAEAVCIPEGTENQRPEYEGLDEAEAMALAAEQGLELREVGEDGECFAITMDLRDDRVNVEYSDGVVIAAAIF